MAVGFFASSIGTPKTRNRFLVNFPGLDSANWWTVKSITRPTVTVNKTEYTLLNHTFYYPGTVRWEPITMTLIDPITPDTTNSLMGMLMASGYRLPSENAGPNTISKAASTVGQVQIKTFGTAAKDMAANSNINAIEQMTLVNCWIEQINFGELSYESDDFLEIELTLAYDYCTFEMPNDTNTANSTGTRLTPGASAAASKLGGTNSGAPTTPLAEAPTGVDPAPDVDGEST